MNIRDALIIGAVSGIVFLVSIAILGMYPSDNRDHAYGEPVGDVISPSLNECALNGHYYPISSGKCTLNMTGTNATFIGGGGGGQVTYPANMVWVQVQGQGQP